MKPEALRKHAAALLDDLKHIDPKQPAILEQTITARMHAAADEQVTLALAARPGSAAAGMERAERFAIFLHLLSSPQVSEATSFHEVADAAWSARARFEEAEERHTRNGL